MKIIYLGHASLHIEFEGTNIIVDPFISGNSLASDIDISALKADFILVTHAHQDHILDVETIAKNTGATIVSNYEISMHYGAKGLHFQMVRMADNLVDLYSQQTENQSILPAIRL